LHIVAQRRRAEPNKGFRTGYLNHRSLTHRNPVPAPGTVLVRSRIVRVDGRKHFVVARMEDEHGELLAKAEVLYISVESKL
ncbi:hypothetical protein CH063_09430, partial [Colletotrichum higginsianum]